MFFQKRVEDWRRLCYWLQQCQDCTFFLSGSSSKCCANLTEAFYLHQSEVRCHQTMTNRQKKCMSVSFSLCQLFILHLPLTPLLCSKVAYVPAAPSHVSLRCWRRSLLAEYPTDAAFMTLRCVSEVATFFFKLLDDFAKVRQDIRTVWSTFRALNQLKLGNFDRVTWENGVIEGEERDHDQAFAGAEGSEAAVLSLDDQLSES